MAIFNIKYIESLLEGVKSDIKEVKRPLTIFYWHTLKWRHVNYDQDICQTSSWVATIVNMSELIKQALSSENSDNITTNRIEAAKLYIDKCYDDGMKKAINENSNNYLVKNDLKISNNVKKAFDNFYNICNINYIAEWLYDYASCENAIKHVLCNEIIQNNYTGVKLRNILSKYKSIYGIEKFKD